MKTKISEAPGSKNLHKLVLTSAIHLAEKLSPQLGANLAYRYWRKTFRHPLPGKEKILFEQADKQPFISKKGKIQLYFWGKGPRILICPGWNGRATQYHRLILSLVESGFEVIGVEPPGHGLSEGNNTSILEIAAIIEELAACYAPMAGFVGHSAGAMAGFSAIAAGAKFERAVFIAMPSNSPTILQGYCQALGLRSETCKFLQQIFEQTHGHDAFIRSSPEQLCDKVHIPSLLIHDEKDTLVPVVHSKSVSEKLNEAELLVTRRFGHFRILNASPVVGKICDFFNTEFKS